MQDNSPARFSHSGSGVTVCSYFTKYFLTGRRLDVHNVIFFCEEKTHNHVYFCRVTHHSRLQLITQCGTNLRHPVCHPTGSRFLSPAFFATLSLFSSLFARGWEIRRITYEQHTPSTFALPHPCDDVPMGVKKQNNLGVHSGIKVFWILLAISLFEVSVRGRCAAR